MTVDFSTYRTVVIFKFMYCIELTSLQLYSMYSAVLAQHIGVGIDLKKVPRPTILAQSRSRRACHVLCQVCAEPGIS